MMIFNASCLLSKWGNGDGDMLDDLLYVHEIDIDSHELLEIIIKKYVLPKLEQKVELAVIGTIHNPIRAKTIGGVDVTNKWYTNLFFYYRH